MMTPRHGFTLVEILISTAIFAVVSVAMIGIYATATDLVRLGESRRAAADEATAALAMLDDDLLRITPPEAGGFFFTQSPPDPSHPSGCMTMAFVISDPAAITQRAPSGSAPADASRLVMWMTDRQGVLWRRSAQAPDRNRMTTVSSWYGGGTNGFQEVAKGCILLSVDLPQGTTIEPAGTTPWCTEPIGGAQADAFPTVVRLTVGFTGGPELAPRGRLVRDLATGPGPLRLNGLRQVASPALLRLGDPATGPVEWVAATSRGSGLWEITDRAQHRTVEAPHSRGTLVTTTPTYSLTRSIGR